MSQPTGQPRGGGAEHDDTTATTTESVEGPSVAPPSYGTPSFGPGSPTPGPPAASQPPGVSVGMATTPLLTGTRTSSPPGVDPASATAPSPPDPGARDWREAWREARSGVVDGTGGGAAPLGTDNGDATGAVAAESLGRSDTAGDDGSSAGGGGFRAAMTSGLARAKTLAAGGVAAVASATSSTATRPGTDIATPSTAAGIGVATSVAAGGAATTVLPRPQSTSGLPPATTQPATRQPSPGRSVRRVRRAHLKLTRVDPWTIMKVSFMLAIAFGIMTIVAVAVVWSMLDAAGVFVSLNETVESVTGEGGGALGFDLMSWVAFDRVLGFATLIAVVDVVLITALATLGAFLYNLAASLLGGVEVTFVEDHH